jgi:hypothetical protein
MAYTTLAAVRAELKTVATTDDNLLNGYIALAQRIIEAPLPYGTGRVFEVSVDTTKYFDAPDWDCALLDLRGLDLCAITSVTNGNGDVIPVSGYLTRPRDTTPYYALQLLRTYTWRWASAGPENAIAIMGKWAYSETAPLEIQRCATRIAVWLYKSRDNAGFDTDIKTDEGLILGARMPHDIRTIIAAYRHGMVI